MIHEKIELVNAMMEALNSVDCSKLNEKKLDSMMEELQKCVNKLGD